MRRVLALVSSLAFLLVASPAYAAFGVQDFQLGFAAEDGSPVTQAGSHPDSVITELRLDTRADPVIGEFPEGAIRNVEVSLPEGLVGKPGAVPTCSDADFVNISGEPPISTCPVGSQVGINLARGFFNEYRPGEPGPLYVTSPIFNLEPAPGSVQKVGFFVNRLVPVVIQFYVSQAPPYRVTAKVSDLSQVAPIYSTKLFLWGNPANPSHDPQRSTCINTFAPIEEERINTAEGCSISANVAETAYITLPTNCANPLKTDYFLSSWQGEAASGLDEGPTLTGCEALDLEPSIGAEPTTGSGQSSSGLNFSLDVADEGITNPVGTAQSDIRRAEVTLPEGMTVNPSLASGLGACGVADLQRETLYAEPGEGCPESSKIGAVEVETPLLSEALKGSLFVAKPFENDAGSLLAVYLVIRNRKLGVIIKQTLKVVPNEFTGRVTAIADNIPQLPFSHFRLNFRGGERGPLTTPTECGDYNAQAVITPWSGGPPVTSNKIFRITTGANGGACGVSPFAPSFEAGTLAPLAGKHSPFVLNLSRAPGSPRLSTIEATLPEGLLGRLAGLKECSDPQIAAAKARSAPNQGAVEIASPSCPASSELGTVTVGAGSGAQTFVQGRAYLAGPYKGAPLSLVIITPAVTGPFDLGSVVVRNALYVNPTTAQIHAVSDPLPTILQGIPLDVRSVAINLSRPNFTLNPTSCNPMAVLGGAGALTGQSASLRSSFQVGGCTGLKFSPKLSLSFSGATRRTGNPALKAVLTQANGQANIDKVTVVLPKSQFIDNRHINNPCTRPQFNANSCPKGSILGTATAYSPLLDKPLKGRVYFRSNGGDRELPDMVAALRGQIDLDVVGYIDSVKKKGSESSRVRTRFVTVPDAPVSKFVLQLKGGKRGLIQNSENLCSGERSSTVKMVGQNGKTHDLTPVLGVKCEGKGSKKEK